MFLAEPVARIGRGKRVQAMSTSHTLYLFLAPPLPVREAVGRIRDLLGTVPRPVADDRLHMTVGAFGRFAETPHAGIEWVRRRLQGAALPSFRICLDTLVRTSGRALLMPGEPPAGFDRLQRALLERLGLHSASWRGIRPHVTIGYGGSPAATQAVDPIGWTADRLLLVESLVGEQRHIVHEGWTLTAEAKRAA
jgi:2'-5' RNA ligase